MQIYSLPAKGAFEVAEIEISSVDNAALRSQMLHHRSSQAR